MKSSPINYHINRTLIVLRTPMLRTTWITSRRCLPCSSNGRLKNSSGEIEKCIGGSA
ncbi:unnamed protein product, partial [Nesidiocoris tenuis]